MGDGTIEANDEADLMKKEDGEQQERRGDKWPKDN
jgi:hypothetical protein